MKDRRKVYWGDLHAHCGVSYGEGTPQRALDNARQHLDFCSLTGHAFWPDMPMDLGTGPLGQDIGKHLGGFTKLQHYWGSLMALLDRANVNGRFVTFPSYEWHCREFGDRNCYFNSCNVKLIDAPDVATLAGRLKRQKVDCMILPHHCGYAPGHRALKWDGFDGRVSPLIEVYSSHGCAEADDAPYEYHHSMGPRVGESMVRRGLLAGHRFGFIAGTDNHDGYPGHYGHGRAGVFAPRLDRRSIWKALKGRRTIATTGARIAAQVSLGTSEIGQVTARRAGMPLAVEIEGTAPIDKVEIVEASGRNWRVRRLPVGPLCADFQPGRYKVKVEAGWGAAGQCSNWQVAARIKRGKLLGCHPCFRFSQHDWRDQACDRILACDDNEVQWTCRAEANPAGMVGGTHFDAGGPQAVVLDIDATRGTRLEVVAGKIKFDLPLVDLANHSTARHVGGITTPAIKVHRAVPEREFGYCFAEVYEPLGEEPGFVYLRVTQCDGQVAWVSPIWFE